LYKLQFRNMRRFVDPGLSYLTLLGYAANTAIFLPLGEFFGLVVRMRQLNGRILYAAAAGLGYNFFSDGRSRFRSRGRRNLNESF